MRKAHGDYAGRLGRNRESLHYLLGEPIVQVSAMLGTYDKKYPEYAVVVERKNGETIK